MSSEAKFLAPLLPVLLALICFEPTLNYGFVHDDIYHVVQAGSVLSDFSVANIKFAFTTDSWTFLMRDYPADKKFASFYYRPMLSLYLMLSYAYAGTDARLWHLTSVLLHAVAVIIAYFAIYLSLENLAQPQSRFLAAVASCVFAIHPVQAESVAWISASANSLTAIPMLAALIAYLKARRKQRYFWLFISAILYGLALLTKEFAVALLLLLACYELFLFERERSLKTRLLGFLLQLLPFLVVTSAYLIVRVWLGIDFGQRSLPFSAQIYTLPVLLLTYFKNIFFPFYLLPFYPIYHVTSAWSPDFYVPAILLVLLAVAAGMLSRDVHVRLALIWILVPLFPALNIRPLKVEHLIFDRYLYLSTIGAGLLLGYGAAYLGSLSKPLAFRMRIYLGIVIAGLFVVTIRQNQVWVDEWSYWQTTQQAIPRHCTANKELGRLFSEHNVIPQAIYHYQIAAESCSDKTNLHFQIGTLYLNQNRLDEAEVELQYVLQHANSPEMKAACYYNLALVAQRRGESDKSADLCNKVLEVAPQSRIADHARSKLAELNNFFLRRHSVSSLP
ncbi:MAG: tetratricopeptide repeat protein [Acidobacteriota bacterium]|nr:tetratricopeptide repeat protein [Blastocatellia bacterium]MDW8413459.1 tetratricopeptide repeat protein [Acidobacteriota bacterium]